MKVLILLVVVSLSSQLYAQKDTGVLPYLDGKIHFTNVVAVDSVSKETLIKNAIIWFEKTTNDYNNSISNKISYGLKDNTILKNIDTGRNMNSVTSLESVDKKRFKKLMTSIYKSCKSAIEKLNQQMIKQRDF